MDALQQEQVARPVKRSLASVAAALLCASALVAAPAIHVTVSTTAPPASRTRDADHLDGDSSNDAAMGPRCRLSVRSFLGISAACILSAWALLLLFATSSRARLWILQCQQAARGRQMALAPLFYVALSALTLGIGFFGLWTHCPDADSSGPHWPATMALVIAVLWIVAAVVLVGVAILTALREVPPDGRGQERVPALILLRCSCCSVTVKRLLLALPLAALCTVSATHSQHTSALHDASECVSRAHEARVLLVGDSILFGVMLLTLAATSLVQLVVQRNEQSTLASRKRRRLLTLVLLMAFTGASISWAIKSCAWLQRADSFCWKDGRVVEAIELTTAALFAVGGLLLMLTCCCRIERHMLGTTNTPPIDLGMLSPHAIRPPALTKSPPAAHAGDAV